MSGWLIAFVGVIYGMVAIDQGYKGNWPMAIVWGGYCFSQWGLLIVTVNQK